MSIIDKFKRLHRQLNGSTLELNLDSYQNRVDEINRYESNLISGFSEWRGVSN
jgi:hypothetical protein